MLRHNRSPIIPKVDMELIFSPRTSQLSLFRISLPSPTIHTSSHQISHLEQPSSPSNQSQMDENNLPLPHMDDDSSHLQRTAIGVEIYTLLQLFTPASSAPHQRPRIHTYASHFLSAHSSCSPQPLLLRINAPESIHTLHIFYLPLPLPFPHYPPYFCALMNSLSMDFVHLLVWLIMTIC